AVRRIRGVCAGPLPHPASQRQYARWEAGWGSGPAPQLTEIKMPESLPYSIDKEGTVYFGTRVVKVPKTVSPEAQAYLATPPWGDTLPTFDGVEPAWKNRAQADAGLKALAEQARGLYPVASITEKFIGGVRTDIVRPLEVA